MASTDTVFETDITALTLVARGKVRDIYAVDKQHLAIVATDRLSAYDVIMPDPIPGKGEILTQISRFWFKLLAPTVDNHLTALTLAQVAGDTDYHRALESRTMIVKRLRPLPVEAVARGYLIGSGWRDYVRSGQVCGHQLPAGMMMAQALPTPLFTPATKAEAGDHDENIDMETMRQLIGDDIAQQVRDVTMRIYEIGTAHAAARGIIIADTKLEFGLDDNGKLHLIDEVLTPDSSRFWPANEYQPDSSPPSFDKQFVRDYLDTLDWDKRAPGPSLPPAVLDGTAQRYHQALSLLTAPRR